MGNAERATKGEGKPRHSELARENLVFHTGLSAWAFNHRRHLVTW